MNPLLNTTLQRDELLRVASIVYRYSSEEGFERYKAQRKAGTLPLEIEDAFREWQIFLATNSKEDVIGILQGLSC